MKVDNVICPYCNKPATWTTRNKANSKVHKNEFMIWLCKECDAYVSCVDNSKRPIGTMANRALRKKRIYAHVVFDRIWKKGIKKRGTLYKRMSDHFGYKLHIGTANIQECNKIIEWSRSLFNKNGDDKND